MNDGLEDAKHGGAACVSAIVPTHGRPELLRRALASITRQTLLPAEVLVVDDLDDEETSKILAELALTYPVPLRHIRNKTNRGACGSRNLGAATAQCPTIAFLDDDDEWLETFLADTSRTLATTDSAFVCTEIDRVFPDGTVKRLVPPDGLTAANVLSRRGYMTGSSFIIRKDIFNAVGGFDPAVSVFNDWDLFIRLVQAHHRYRVVHSPLVRWIEHTGDRITTGTIRRADGLDRFLSTYGREMGPGIRMYYNRLAFGIRKAHEPSRWRRAKLTARMLRAGGLWGMLTLLTGKVE